MIWDKLVIAVNQTRTSNRNAIMVISAASEALGGDKETVVFSSTL